MALRFRLKGLAETFIEKIVCPGCSCSGGDDQAFSTELTKVTLEGIIIIVQCKTCHEIFVPDTQRMGILDPSELKIAVHKDASETGECIMPNYEAVRLTAERLNALRKGEVH